MIAALGETTVPTVERTGWLLLVVGLAWATFYLRRSRGAPTLLAFLPLPTALIVLGAFAGRIRDDAIAHGVGQFPDRFVPSFVAVSHAGAMRATWWLSLVAAVLVAAPAVSLARGAGPWERRPTAILALATGGLLVVAALLGAGEAGWCAVPCALAAAALATDEVGPSHLLAALALVIAAVAAPIGADAALFRYVALARASDLEAIDPAVVGRLVAMSATGLGLATAAVVLIRARSTAADVAAIGAAMMVAFGMGSRDAGLAPGPQERLGDLALPVVRVEPPFRVASGCLVTPAGAGWSGVALGRGACPAVVAPGAFARDEVPLVVLPEDAPAAGLAGWSEPGGSAAALVRLDAGGAVPAWRVAQLPFETWDLAHDLPVEGGTVVVRPGTPAEQVQASLADRRRADVLFAPLATVGEVVRTCAVVQRIGIACGVGLGAIEDWERWAGTEP